jgi:hypothetical protein
MYSIHFSIARFRGLSSSTSKLIKVGRVWSRSTGADPFIYCTISCTPMLADLECYTTLSQRTQLDNISHGRFRAGGSWYIYLYRQLESDIGFSADIN